MNVDTFIECIESIGKFCSYLLHPVKTLGMIWGFTVSISKVAGIAVCLIALIMYIGTGSDKAKRVSIGSPIVYTLIKTIDAMLKGVI